MPSFARRHRRRRAETSGRSARFPRRRPAPGLRPEASPSTSRICSTSPNRAFDCASAASRKRSRCPPFPTRAWIARTATAPASATATASRRSTRSVRGWSLLGIAQYQPDGRRNQPAARAAVVRRRRESVSPAIFALRRSDETGPWALASLSYSVYPDSLVEDGRRENYSGLVANAMRRIPVEGFGTAAHRRFAGLRARHPAVHIGVGVAIPCGLAGDRESRRLRTLGPGIRRRLHAHRSRLAPVPGPGQRDNGSRKPATGSGRSPG